MMHKGIKHYRGKQHIIVYSLDSIKILKNYGGLTIGWITLIKVVGFNYEKKPIYLCRDIFGEEFVLCWKYFSVRKSAYTVCTPKSKLKLKKINECYFSILKRCLNPDHPCSKHYYHKGVKVCDEWLGEMGRINFVTWAVKNGFEIGLTIDRIGKHYTPQGCRWVTKTFNSRHTSSVKLDEEKVESIRTEYSKCTGTINKFKEQQAAKYGVTAKYIGHIIYNQRWN